MDEIQAAVDESLDTIQQGGAQVAAQRELFFEVMRAYKNNPAAAFEELLAVLKGAADIIESGL